MIESDAVEGIFQRENALDFVSVDHRDEHVAHGGDGLEAQGFKSTAKRGRRFTGCGCSTGPVRYGENRAEVVGGMTPFSGEPRIVKIKPANDRSDIEGRLD